MKELKNAVIVNGVAYTINATEAKKVAELLGLNIASQPTSQPKAEPKAKKESPKAQSKTRVVGSLEQSGAYIRTTKGVFLNSKVRYAIKMAAADAGATKLGKGNKVYDTYVKDDKYVQIYQFQSVADAEKFMDAQQSRMAK